MSEEQKTVETKVETAVAQQEVDLGAELEKTKADLAKVQQEKENYRKGMLKAKGKLPEDESADEVPPENWREEARRIAREEYLTTQEAQLQAKQDDLVTSLVKKNSELTTALKNRSQVTSPSGSGANQDKPEIKTDAYFSPEQLSALKAKGWSDKKIEEAKKNMIRSNQMPPIIK